MDNMNNSISIDLPTQNLYNVQIIVFANGKRYVTVRQDTRDEDGIYASRNDGDAPVYQTLRDGWKFYTINPEHLQGISIVDAKRAQHSILDGYDAEYGEDMVLNVKGRPIPKVA